MKAMTKSTATATSSSRRSCRLLIPKIWPKRMLVAAVANPW